MASAFSHIAVPAVLYASFKSETVTIRLFLLAALCSVFPDIDVIGFKFGIPYASQWGHRGFTHSLFFALGLACLLTLFHRQPDLGVGACRQRTRQQGGLRRAEGGGRQTRITALVSEVLHKARNHWGLIDCVPPIRKFVEPKKRIRWLTPDEVVRLLVKLLPHLEAMHVKRSQLGNNPRYVFVYKGKPVLRANNHAWIKALARAEIADLRCWHDLRHTLASLHVQAGTPLNVLPAHFGQFLTELGSAVEVPDIIGKDAAVIRAKGLATILAKLPKSKLGK